MKSFRKNQLRKVFLALLLIFMIVAIVRLAIVEHSKEQLIGPNLTIVSLSMSALAMFLGILKAEKEKE